MNKCKILSSVLEKREKVKNNLQTTKQETNKRHVLTFQLVIVRVVEDASVAYSSIE